MTRVEIFAIALLAGGGVLSAQIVPGSSCTYNTASANDQSNPSSIVGIDCNLYPSTNTSGGSGTFSGDVAIPFSSVSGYSSSMEVGTITDGYLVLVANGAAGFTGPGVSADSTLSDWLQVIEFVPTSGSGGVANGGSAAESIELWTEGCGTGNPGDRSCFPSLTTIDNSLNWFDQYDASYDPYLWDPSSGSGSAFEPIYNINFVAPTGAPEPTSFLTGLGGLALIAALRRRKRVSK